MTSPTMELLCQRGRYVIFEMPWLADRLGDTPRAALPLSRDARLEDLMTTALEEFERLFSHHGVSDLLDGVPDDPDSWKISVVISPKAAA